MKKITQVEARALRAKVSRLEKVLYDQRHNWGKEWPDGIMIGELTADALLARSIHVARLLKHAVVVTEYENKLYFHAMEQPKV